MRTPDALAAGRAGLSQQHSLVLSFGDALMGDQMAGIELDLDFVFGFAHFHSSADPVHRYRVTIAVRSHISFHIHDVLCRRLTSGTQNGSGSARLLPGDFADV